MKKDFKPKIGEIYLMQFSGSESEQTGWRPGVVFQNNVGNEHSPNVIALPLTSQMKKLSQPTHVLLHSCDTGLKKDSIVLCENPQRMSKDKIGAFITRVSEDYMKLIAVGHLLASSAIAFIDEKLLVETWRKAGEFNATAALA